MMKFFFVAAAFVLLFVAVVDSFYVPEVWLAKHGYTLKKQSPFPGWNPRRYHGRNGNRMNQKANDGIPVGPFTDDFMQWLDTSGFAEYNFPALYLGINASYGGKEFKEQELKHTPVIFIHGNSDGALDAGTEFSSGFSSSIKYFLSKGYTSAELYAITWGDRKLENSFKRQHSCATLRRLQVFIRAVLAYTKSKKVSIVAHSMGVTLARQVTKGGFAFDLVESCNLEPPMHYFVSVFLGIAGANFGLCMCDEENSQKLPVCGKEVGFYSGSYCQKSYRDLRRTCASFTWQDQCELYKSSYLMLLAGEYDDVEPPKDGDKVYSFWSEEDEIVGPNSVWGRNTSHIPFSDKFKIFPNMKHHQLKTDTAAEQFALVVEPYAENILPINIFKVGEV